jgi:GWxTD domain-containing protein
VTHPVRSGFRTFARPPLRALTAGVLLAFAALGACRLYKLERQLSPDQAEFLDKVGYIITREERKVFLELPDERKDEFIEEFWRRRDPDPGTEHNAFKAEYEERVARAAILFPGEGRPGWQTDRGRIFILFGPPRERMTYPMDAGGFCREIWYYGAFPVVFIDEHCSGRFVLTAVNLEHLHRLNIAQGHFQRTIQEEDKRLFDYEVSVHKVRSEPALVEGAVRVDIPYASIWFTFRDGRLETAFDLKLSLSDGTGREVWTARSTFPITLQEEELVAQRDRIFRMEVPFVLEDGLDRLRGQTLTLHISVASTTEGGELKKVLELRLES